jgi:hypothetical protein
MKKRQPIKHKGLKIRTIDEKRGNHQIVRGSKQRPLMKKEATTKM